MADNLSTMKNTQAPSAKKDFPTLLKSFVPELARALPSHMNADRMARIALTEFRKNPALAKCEPMSIIAAVVQSAQLGLEVGIMGQAYLIPYGNQCQFVSGWQGLADLVSRSGRASVWTGAVYEGDEFDYGMGDKQFVHHKAGDNHGDDKFLTHVYAIGRIKDAEWPVIEVWTAKRVERHRDKYNKVGKRHYSYENFAMYGRKVALLQVIKYMPKSVELTMAMELDNAAENGMQHLNVNDAIQGTWTPVVEAAPVDNDAPTEELSRAQVGDGRVYQNGQQVELGQREHAPITSNVDDPFNEGGME